MPSPPRRRHHLPLPLLLLLLVSQLLLRSPASTPLQPQQPQQPQQPLPPASATLVESMPTGLEEVLPRLPGIGDTAQHQIALLEGSRETVDVTVMYWNLLATPGNFSSAQMKGFGADRGAALYAAFEAAAARGVAIRILQCSGAAVCSDAEALQLQARYPKAVSVRHWNASAWYGGGGIMHQKLWISDRQNVYRESRPLTRTTWHAAMLPAAASRCLSVASSSPNRRYFGAGLTCRPPALWCGVCAQLGAQTWTGSRSRRSRS
jgi:hypothetical protein